MKDQTLNPAIIDKYIHCLLRDPLHRFLSWDYCNEAFLMPQPTENHILQLAFYLASWGMYRGSGGILQKNHLVHAGAVNILYKPDYQHLKCTQKHEVTKSSITDILNLKRELSKHYQSIEFTRGNTTKHISSTDTLLSKILLGTMGCTPAYDNYFIKGLQAKNFDYNDFERYSLEELFDFINKNKVAIKSCQDNIFQKTKHYYPYMKIIDMYFWQIGYDADLKSKK